MKIQSHEKVQSFLDLTLPMLSEHEALNNFVLGLTLGRKNQKEPVKEGGLLSVEESGSVLAASVLLSRQGHLFISLAPGQLQAAAMLAQYFESRHDRIATVMIDAEAGPAFDAAFTKPVRVRHRLLAHELKTLKPQPAAAGHAEWATAEDQHWVADWIIAFETEAHISRSGDREEYEQKAAIMIGNNIVLKWMHEGRHVSLSALVRQTPTLGVVGLVYTPPAERGRGYATSCVEHLSRHILNSGMQGCALFTDATNPASNHIYQKMGYVKVGELVEMEY